MLSISSKGQDDAILGLMIHINKWIGNRYSTYSHTKREGNTVAHNLAQLAVNFSNCVIWMEDVPCDVMTSYHADLADISEYIAP